MNATVMTTGPGVIISPYRNGTIANPLPNTNAPALAKIQKIFVRVGAIATAGV
jgi:hypothetical protein